MNRVPENLGDLFDAIVSKHHSRDAIVYSDDRKLSYGELYALSERTAVTLCSSGLRTGNCVLISGDKTPAMFAAILAALKLGIVYSVYDPDIPVARLTQVMGVCMPAMLLGSTLEQINTAKRHGIIAMFLSGGDHEAPTVIASSASQSRSVKGDDLAYIVFTSGSTGVPKGAAMSHGNVLSLIGWSSSEFTFGPGEILTNLNPCYFDNFVFDFYSALFTGATLVPFTMDEVRNPPLLIASIEAAGCTSWFSVPSVLIYLNAMKALASARFPNMRRFIFGGEGYPKAKLVQVYETYKRRIGFYNVYGPSECTCIASCYKVSDGDFTDLKGFLPIGALIPTFSYLIVNDALDLLPPDETGELCLVGPGVGLGYYNQPEITERSFIPRARLAGQTGEERVYRTGDLVCLNSSDDKLHIFGRSDNQIKHMGYRIELEDIENALMRLSYVVQACCTHNHKNGISRITCFMAMASDRSILQIKGDLSALLSAYMMPTHFVFMNELPKNKNGKVDRVALTASVDQAP